MQTIKYEQNGEFHYRKPSIANGEQPYKPIRKNRNGWYFPHPLNANISKEIYEMGMRYYELMLDPHKRPRRRFKNPTSLVNVLYFIYLTGCRQQEVFKKPYPTISFHEKTIDGTKLTWVEITRLNQKQKKEKNKLVDCMMPIFDQWEQKMWEFMSSGGQVTQAEAIFKYKSWKSTKERYICELFENAFKTTLINDNDPERRSQSNAGITPHILRHARAYDILCNRNLERIDCQKILGWASDKMIDHYIDIRNRLAKEDQFNRFRAKGILTSYDIDSARLLMQRSPTG